MNRITDTFVCICENLPAFLPNAGLHIKLQTGVI